MARPVEYPFLENYNPVIQRYLKSVKARGHGSLDELARELGVDNARLSDLLSGRRCLTLKWVMCFVQGGKLAVDDFIKDAEKPMSAEEKEFWDTVRVFQRKPLRE